MMNCDTWHLFMSITYLHTNNKWLTFICPNKAHLIKGLSNIFVIYVNDRVRY